MLMPLVIFLVAATVKVCESVYFSQELLDSKSIFSHLTTVYTSKLGRKVFYALWSWCNCIFILLLHVLKKILVNPRKIVSLHKCMCYFGRKRFEFFS